MTSLPSQHFGEVWRKPGNRKDLNDVEDDEYDDSRP